MSHWTDSEQVLHAKQAINAYEAQRAENRLPAALVHLKRAIDALFQATFAIEDQIALEAKKAPFAAKKGDA